MYISGPSPPVRPSVQVVNVTASSAIVQWVVAYLAYTQEHYEVSYGPARERLNQSRLVVNSETNSSTSNITYSVSFQDLIPNSVYFFQLRSTNTQGETLSNIMMLTTLEAGMHQLISS